MVARASPSCGADTLRMAERPRPIPVVLATGGDLLGQFEVGVGPGAVRVVQDHRDTEARGLADPDVAGDDRVEDERREVLAHLALHVPAQVGARVVHGQEHPGDREARVQLLLHQREGVEPRLVVLPLSFRSIPQDGTGVVTQTLTRVTEAAEPPAAEKKNTESGTNSVDAVKVLDVVDYIENNGIP